MSLTSVAELQQAGSPAIAAALIVPEGILSSPEDFLQRTPMQGRQNEGELRNLINIPLCELPK